MEHILRKIQETEKEANRIIEDAKNKTVEMVSLFNKEKEQAEAELQSYKKDIIEKKRKEANKEFEEIKKAIDQDWNSIKQNMEKVVSQKRDAVIKHILQEVIG